MTDQATEKETVVIGSTEWQERMMADAIRVARLKHNAHRAKHRFTRYQNDPVGFCHRYLNVTFSNDIRAMMESVRDNPVTIARSANGTGKSHSAAHIAVWWLLCFPDSQVYVAAAPPLDNLRTILWGELLKITSAHPDIFNGIDVFDLFIGKKDEAHWIRGLAIPTSGSTEEREAKFSGHHAPHLMFILDEGDAIPDECYKGIEGCKSGGVTRQLILFNPKIQTGPVYQKEREQRAHVVEISAFRHPNVVTGKDIYPGAVTRATVITRIHEWTRPLMEGESLGVDTFEVPEFLVGQTAIRDNGELYQPLVAGTRKIVDPMFSYKVLGQYPAQGETQLISDEWIRDARDRYDTYVLLNGNVPPPVQPRMGLDIAEYGTDWNMCCLRYGGYVAPFIFWAGMDTDASADRALETYTFYRPSICIVDATSLGSGIAPGMVRKARERQVGPCYAFGIKANNKPSTTIRTDMGEFQYMRDQLWWGLREWLRTDPTAMLPNDPMLIEEIKAVTYAPKQGNGKITVTDKPTLRKILKRSPDRADALCLTFAPTERAKVMLAIQEERNQ